MSSAECNRERPDRSRRFLVRAIEPAPDNTWEQTRERIAFVTGARKACDAYGQFACLNFPEAFQTADDRLWAGGAAAGYGEDRPIVDGTQTFFLAQRRIREIL